MALISIFGKEDISYIEELKQCYHTLEKGYNSLAINIPGTLFYTAMKARRKLGQIVARILSSRRQRKAEASDLLGSFMQADNLTNDQITDNIIGVLFAARDTTASVLTWIIKFLGENPAILEAVTVKYHSYLLSSSQAILDNSSIEVYVRFCIYRKNIRKSSRTERCAIRGGP